MQRHISAKMRDRIMRLWDDRECFVSALDRLPQILTHGDMQRRNLIIRTGVNGRDELIAVDWAKCGIGPLAGDLSFLVGNSALMFEWASTDLQSLETVAVSEYLAGLCDAGWNGDPRHIRLGYSAHMALWLGVTMPHAIATFTRDGMQADATQKMGCHSDELAAGWSALGEFALERADEARQLMQQVKL